MKNYFSSVKNLLVCLSLALFVVGTAGCGHYGHKRCGCAKGESAACTDKECKGCKGECPMKKGDGSEVKSEEKPAEAATK